MILTQINWNPDPEIFNILGISIRYYSLLFLSGILLSITVLKWIFKQEKLPEANLEKLSMYGIIGILLGARLGHCLFYEPGYYLNHPLEILLPIQFTSSSGIEFTGYRGLASHGGALGLIIALFLYSRKTKHSMLDTIDLIAVVTGLGAGFIRLANLMNSEIVGMPSNKAWAFVFERIDTIPRHPAQLYEAICYFLIFAFMLFLYKTKRAQFKNGVLFGTVLFLIFTARFFIEFVKENQVAFESGMQFNMGQLLSIPYIIVGLGFIAYGISKTKKQLSLQV
ncbi:prolipoprotein diacylglyceryl transferase [Marinifilum flexuosum]|uniref:Phosphatidylglycerol--prolipoprotein diacylglyceryl transferase n=1 Tax=Marinifilum flexuosum TaxID=1117708 RepID=A0A419X477_9BACT|nr:prolipoprotein diacylglyceryl transferase [Marinifilum flexuosum]RKE02419.1 prolipoprotein diacylglyceryl transferase [Marinifilum flexuosum]